MATDQMNQVIRHLRRTALLRDGGDLTDGQLLGCFLDHQDECAFEALVRRHGPMVLGVCRRVLNHAHDAEDAFQATFLVLVRKAASIVPPELVGHWLYGVAYRTALEARTMASRRRSRERQVSEMPERAAPETEVWSDLRPLLDQELSQLPDLYQVPVVLCDLEGRKRKEVARQLGIPESTLSGRLTTARRLLAKRLARHGLTLSGGAVAAALSAGAASACVPAPLVVSTVKAATLVAAGQAAAGAISAPVVALTEGVLKAMFLTKMKTLASVLAVACFLTASLGLLWQSSWVAHAPAAPAATGQDTPKDKDKPADNPDKKEPAKKEETKKGDPNEVPFSKIHVQNTGKVVITQTGKQALEAKGNPLLVRNVQTGVENDTLHLQGHPGVEFNVEVKELSGLTVEGIGTVEVKDLKTKRLEVTVKGGKALVSGTAEEQVINVSGVGRFDGEDCKGKQAKVQVTGGSAVVNVSDKLQVDIQGVGRVNYLGSPTVEKNVAFGGQLVAGAAPANVGGFGAPAFAGFQGGLEQRLGARLESPSATLIDQLSLPEKQGMVLKEVKKDSAADKAGLKANDILLELDGKPVPSSPNGFSELLKGIKADQKVAVVVVRKGQKVDVKDLTLPEAKNAPGFRPFTVPPVPPLQLPPVPKPPADDSKE